LESVFLFRQLLANVAQARRELISIIAAARLRQRVRGKLVFAAFDQDSGASVWKKRASDRSKAARSPSILARSISERAISSSMRWRSVVASRSKLFALGSQLLSNQRQLTS
jgi:hypothetical protein